MSILSIHSFLDTSLFTSQPGGMLGITRGLDGSGLGSGADMFGQQGSGLFGFRSNLGGGVRANSSGLAGGGLNFTWIYYTWWIIFIIIFG